MIAAIEYAMQAIPELLDGDEECSLIRLEWVDETLLPIDDDLTDYQCRTLLVCALEVNRLISRGWVK